MVKRLPTMWETQVRSLGQEDPLEKKMATHSSILAWKIPRTKEPGWLLSMGLQSRTRLSNFTIYLSIQILKVSLKILCCHDDTWFHQNLTFLKPWANQCVFLMEMLFLGYVNELCIYPRLCFFSSPFSLRLRIEKGSTNQYVLLIYVLLICVNETISLLGNLPYFKIHVNCFMALDDSPCANVTSKCMLWVRGLVPLWVLRHLLSLINSLQIGI